MRRTLLLGGGAVLILLGIAAWLLGLFSSDPAEVSLAETVAAIAREEAELQDGDTAARGADDTTTPTTATQSTAEDETQSETETEADSRCVLETTFPAATGVGEAPTSAAELDGTWVVETGDQTFIGYRIDEILSGVDFTAVGRSSGVAGAITIEDATLTDASIVANLSWLTSDSRIRDNQMKTQALQTGRFPAACFDLTEPIPLPTLPAEGDAVTLTAVGEFVIHGVVQPHELPLDATIIGDRLVIVGSTTVALADFDVDTPSAPAVAGVSDTATIELSLVLQR